MVSSCPNIAVVLPRFGRGGAELVVINMIEALAQVSAPALITIDKPHLQDIDRCYGSSLQRQEVKKADGASSVAAGESLSSLRTVSTLSGSPRDAGTLHEAERASI